MERPPPVEDAVLSGNKEKQREYGRRGGLAAAKKHRTKQAMDAAWAEKAERRRQAERSREYQRDYLETNYHLIPLETYD